MTIRVHIDNMKEAERFSNACREFPVEFCIRADHFCTDPKSVLGVLALMYSNRNSICVDTGEMDDDMLPRFTARIADFIVTEG